MTLANDGGEGARDGRAEPWEAWSQGADRAPDCFLDERVRILLVEADPGVRGRLEDLLRRARHSVFALDRAGDLETALARLRDGGCDVCLAGARLPDGDGLDLVRAAQSRDLAVPVIVLAAHATLERDLEAMMLGAADLLDVARLDAGLLERTVRYALARRRQAARLSHLAQHDELTGLANRALFQDRLHRALAWARRHNRLAAVMVLDLNGFKAVNDRLGHVAGDRLLGVVAGRLRRRVRETDTVARLGGDEFALVIENLAKPEHAALVTRKLLDAIAPPIELEGHEVAVTASLGVALFPRDGTDGETLLRQADAAMYRAKAEGGNLCRFCSVQLEQRAQRGALLRSDLRRGLAEGEFVLHYQPQVTLTAAELGIAGQLRWRHPELGLIGPERFLPLAEDGGLLAELTEWMLSAGCAQLCRWRELGANLPHLALPLLSRRQLAWTGLAPGLGEILERAGLPPDRLELELDEDILLADLDAGRGGLRALERLGVRIALGGYGRGPTSLRGFRAGVLDTLKLSRELLDGVPEQAEPTALVGTLIELARDLGLRVVAEGVERQAQLALLRRRGCDAVQALMSCPPLPAEACTSWLIEAAGRRPGAGTAPRSLPPPATQRVTA